MIFTDLKRVLVTGPHRAGTTIATEMIAEETDPVFLEKWKKENKGKVRIKPAKNPGGSGGTAGTPATTGTEAAPASKKKMFG